MYDRTRENASSQSCQRSKELDTKGVVGTHPMLAGMVDSTELKRQDFIRNASSYRPGATIFEHGKSLIDPKLQMMNAKRLMHSKVIQKQKLVLELSTNELSFTKKTKTKITLEQSNVKQLASTFNTVIAPGAIKAKMIEAAEGDTETEAKLALATGDSRLRDAPGELSLERSIVVKEKEFKVASRPKDEYTDKHLEVSGSFATKVTQLHQAKTSPVVVQRTIL